MQLVDKLKEFFSSAITCLRISPCGQLSARIFNAKVGWALVILYPATLWITAFTFAVIRNETTHVSWKFWVGLGLSSLLILIPFHVVHEISREWGGPIQYCLRMDGRDFPCFGVRTNTLQGGARYVTIPTSDASDGVGIRQSTPDKETTSHAARVRGEDSTTPRTTQAV